MNQELHCPDTMHARPWCRLTAATAVAPPRSTPPAAPVVAAPAQPRLAAAPAAGVAGQPARRARGGACVHGVQGRGVPLLPPRLPHVSIRAPAAANPSSPLCTLQCGLDKGLHVPEGADWQLQLEAFEQQLRLAQELWRPVSVRAPSRARGCARAAGQPAVFAAVQAAPARGRPPVARCPCPALSRPPTTRPSHRSTVCELMGPCTTRCAGWRSTCLWCCTPGRGLLT